MSSNRQGRRRSSSHRGDLRSRIDFSEDAQSWALFPEDDYAESRNREKDRKDRMLSAQVERALGFALHEEAPELADSLLVENVEPCPNAGRLLVRLREVVRTEAGSFELERQVRESKGRLRSSVANYINRKRAPELVFAVIGFEEFEL